MKYWDTQSILKDIGRWPRWHTHDETSQRVSLTVSASHSRSSVWSSFFSPDPEKQFMEDILDDIFTEDIPEVKDVDKDDHHLSQKHSLRRTWEDQVWLFISWRIQKVQISRLFRNWWRAWLLLTLFETKLWKKQNGFYTKYTQNTFIININQMFLENNFKMKSTYSCISFYS